MKERLAARILPVDAMTVLFILANIAFVALARDAIPEPGSIVVGYLICLVVTVVVVASGGTERYRQRSTGCMAFLRWFHGLARQAYPLAFFAFFFVAVTRFDNVIFRNDLDPVFAAIDRALFGSVPSEWLMVRFESYLLSELFHGAYVVYYLSIPGLALWLYVKDRSALPEYMITVTLLFYAACLTYAILPVVGARFDPATRALAEAYRFGPFTRIMAFVYRSSAHLGAAFPSTHVTISLVIALVARRRARPLARLLAVNAGLVMAATIYCGYHYFVDILGALVYVAALYPAALRLAGWRRERDNDVVGRRRATAKGMSNKPPRNDA